MRGIVVRAVAFIAIISQPVRGSNEWDLLIFTQNWPPAVCEHYHDSGEGHQCAQIKTVDSWTVHGVWPTKLHTLGPGFCDPSLKFDPDLITPLWGELQTAWPGIEVHTGETSLWEHEWTKHGTCAVQLPAMDSEMKYFRNGLDWFYRYNMSQILNENGIMPSDSQEYPVHLFRDAVMTSLGVNPHIECIFQKHTHNPHLLEIRICFDKALHLIDCDGTMGVDERPILTNCPLDKSILYSTRMSQPDDLGLSELDMETQNQRFSTARMLRSAIEVLVFLEWVI